VVKIGNTIKTLILEFLESNGAGHLQEIHLQVMEFRPEVPQHTVRARLSEMSRSQNLEEKLSAFGDGYYGLYDENKDLCSLFRAGLGSTQSGRRPFTLMYFEILKNVGLWWGYNLIDGKK
jgi:hypothetical protein